MEFFATFVLVLCFAFAALFVFVGGGLMLAGEAGGFLGYFIALIVCGLVGYFVMPRITPR